MDSSSSKILTFTETDQGTCVTVPISPDPMEKDSGSDKDANFPLDKLSLGLFKQHKLPIPEAEKRKYVVLVSTGSFNPPTYMHLRCFELARDTLNSQGFCVIGGYMSPVNDAYKKKGLISAKHRIAMCHLACKSSDFIMVDQWEANQNTYQHTLTVLSRIKTSLSNSGLESDLLKVMLVCGSDLLKSFSSPGVWIREHVILIKHDLSLHNNIIIQIPDGP